MICELEDKIFDVDSSGFDTLALDIFRMQHNKNQVYRSFCDALSVDPLAVNELRQIPFLPVSFFKQFAIQTDEWQPEIVFESSGTTHTGNSRHLVRKLDLYRQSFTKGFEWFYGAPTDWCIVGLLPSYLERKNSSLVVMVKELIERSNHPNSGFYLYDTDALMKRLEENENAGQKTLLIGVTFALLDLVEKNKLNLRHTVIMETGGMKGRRRELTREELHEQLKAGLGVDAVHSEYGMTELLSQAYSKRDGLFNCPPWMKILIREEDDPLTIYPPVAKEVTGLVNVIDLANIHSCSFIAIDDIGKLYPDDSFEILGRMDSSDLRGCSLMYA